MELEDRDAALRGDKAPPAVPLQKLAIGADYYALSFCSFMKHYRDKHSITAEQKSMFFVNVCFIYGIQIFLLVLAYYNMIVLVH